MGVAASQLLNFWDYIVVSSLRGHISLSQFHPNVNRGSPRPIELEGSTPEPDTWAEGGGPINRLLEKPSLKEKGLFHQTAQTGSVTGSHSVSGHTDPILTFHQTRRKLVKQLRVCVASAYMFVFVEKSTSCWMIFWSIPNVSVHELSKSLLEMYCRCAQHLLWHISGFFYTQHQLWSGRFTPTAFVSTCHTMDTLQFSHQGNAKTKNFSTWRL